MSVAEPSAIEDSNPADETVATAAFDELHVTVGSDTMLPSASFTVATSVTVSPRDVKFTVVGDSVTDAAV